MSSLSLPRIAVASLWMYQGLWCKLLGHAPHHRNIVETTLFLNSFWARRLLLALGVFECVLAGWAFSGIRAREAALGGNFFLSGYRIFVRLRNGGSSLRGLRILRSDTNCLWMARAGNLLTRYQYRLCQAEVSERPRGTEWILRTPGKEADLHVFARTGDAPEPLPPESPFLHEKDARRFAGPLPYTFDYEPETHSIIRIRGVRRNWHPTPVRAEVLENTFLSREPFCRAKPILANTFYVRHVPYRWSRGVRVSLDSK